ncbi:MAG: aminotransferase class V-fold PLP-dependent enzyme [Lachnospiraceae bacterium]|nr:aminotransferase class V-fold PLP-dependent enzyme [Lachnospiraceae bacterium]
MMPFFMENYANPASVYGPARKAKAAVTQARRRVAALIGAKPEEIYFTSGGSESDNWAIRGVAETGQPEQSETGQGQKYAVDCGGGETGQSEQNRTGHMITTRIEHHAVLHTCEALERKGWDITYLTPDQAGVVAPEDVERAIRPDTRLISVMFANNEIGTIQKVREIGQIAHNRGILFHTDAVQAVGHVPVRVDEMHIDLLSASAHKFHGPKGIGFLYIRKGTAMEPLIFGGAQERSRRGGTHHVPGIVGMGKAAELAMEKMGERMRRETELRDRLITDVLREIPDAILNGSRTGRLPNNVNICIPGVEGESVLILLDAHDICASSGSACTSGSLEPSHVLRAIGLTDDIARGSLRLTLSHETTEEEIGETVRVLKEIVGRLKQATDYSQQ